jgi:ubiquinone/menaquinone biosynthesis C-methylase UbiE
MQNKIIDSERKVTLRNHIDKISSERNKWISANSAFYRDDYNFMRFLVSKGQKVLDLGCGTGQLLAELEPSVGVGVDFSNEMIDIASKDYPQYQFKYGDVEEISCLKNQGQSFDAIILSDLIGQLDDVGKLFQNLKYVCNERTRVIISFHSPLWELALTLGEKIGLSMPKPVPSSWLSNEDTIAMLELADFQVVKQEARQLLPRSFFGLGNIINNSFGLLPGIRRLCLRNYIVARAKWKKTQPAASTTIVIPCRNERDNIERAILRTPNFCRNIEFIFVEGGSSDGTLEECKRVSKHYSRKNIKVFQQTGVGKGDAVRKGFAEASGDILMILDADLTVPPEDLPKFYHAIANNHGEFINGTRFVYPMESKAMRFLNYWANRTFSVIFSWLLNQRFTDTLCGTKVIKKIDYEYLQRNRSFFGEFDPFGDFDLLFGASKMNLKIVEIPVRYADRTYGTTQISRFRHGLLLLRMVVFAFRKLKSF